jgi:3-isopropylmalate/(R)-2-methylmalate dehydratase large subunit
MVHLVVWHTGLEHQKLSMYWQPNACSKKMKNMLVRVDGVLGKGVTSKDVVLAIIGKIGTAGGTGHAIEFGGQVFRDMSIEGRMTVCNMAIEAGARVGMVAVDDKTIEYVKDRPYAPKGEQWDQAVAYWNTLHSDEDAHLMQWLY